MHYICTSHLEEDSEAEVWDLLKKSDLEFIPPLSARNSTQEKKLISECMDENGPVAYFEHMKSQNFILAMEDGVAGFLTYISNHPICLKEDREELCEYVSTIIVNPEYRNQDIARRMYQQLFNKCRLPVVTRTWSTNNTHIHILQSLGFKLVKTIKDDRGKGIDTVYYKKM